MLANAANVAELFRGFRVIFMEAYHGAAPPMYEKLAMVVTSNGASESYDWLGAMPTMRKLVGEIQIRNLSANNWKIFNEEFENTIGVKRVDIERDKFGLYRTMLQTMGADARRNPDRLVTPLLVNGFTQKDYTGKNFFDANKAGTPGTRFPFTNFTTKKLSVDNYAAARQNLLERRAANGEPMDLGVDLVLVVSPKNETLAKQILQSDFIMQTAQAAGTGGAAGQVAIAGAAPNNPHKGTARLEVWPRLSSYNADAWFLMEMGLPLKPLIVQIELPPETVGVTNINDTHVVLKKEFIYQAYCREAAGYGMPELIYGSSGADPA
jgi:phage major head subunit gpT-like protein